MPTINNSNDTLKERERQVKIRAAAQAKQSEPAYGARLMQFAEKCCAEGVSYEAFAEEAFRMVTEAQGGTLHRAPNPDVNDLTARERSQINLLSVVRAALDPHSREAGLIFERSQHLAQLYNKKARGILVDADLLAPRKRAMTVTDDTAGGYLVGTAHLAGQFIDALREQSVVLGLGPTIIAGLRGDQFIPKKGGGCTVGWVNLDHLDDISESQMVMSGATLVMHSLAARMTLSHKLIKNSNPDVERLAEQDLIDSIAEKWDWTLIQGTGVPSEPMGVISFDGIDSNTYANAGSPDRDDILTMEQALSDAKALKGNLAFIASPSMRKVLKGVDLGTDTGKYVWTPADNGEGRMEGYRALCTTNCPDDTVIFGNWADLIVGLWGPVDVLVNPFETTSWAKGSVQVRAILDASTSIRHAESFSVLTEAEA